MQHNKRPAVGPRRPLPARPSAPAAAAPPCRCPGSRRRRWWCLHSAGQGAPGPQPPPCPALPAPPTARDKRSRAASAAWPCRLQPLTVVGVAVDAAAGAVGEGGCGRAGEWGSGWVATQRGPALQPARDAWPGGEGLPLGSPAAAKGCCCSTHLHRTTADTAVNTDRTGSAGGRVAEGWLAARAQGCHPWQQGRRASGATGRADRLTAGAAVPGCTARCCTRCTQSCTS